MAVDNVVPNIEIVGFWSVGVVTDIDEGPGTDGNYIQAGQAGGDDNEVDMYGFTTIADVQEVTQIVLWINGVISDAGSSPEFSLDADGNIGSGETGLTTSRGWHSHTFAGLSLTAANLNNLWVGLTADVSVKNSTNTVYTVYCVVTYTPVPTGYTAGRPMGVAPADIKSVCGVLRADIASIKGV